MTNYKTSEKGLQIIKHYEALRLFAYLCLAGIPTIGWGHTKGVKIGDVITEDMALNFLMEDVGECEYFLNKLDLKLNQNQFDALVDFIFNIGEGNFSESTLLKKIKEDPHQMSIYEEFSRWDKSMIKDEKTGKSILKSLPGLKKRRTTEAELFCGGKLILN